MTTKKINSLLPVAWIFTLAGYGFIAAPALPTRNEYDESKMPKSWLTKAVSTGDTNGMGKLKPNYLLSADSSTVILGRFLENLPRIGPAEITYGDGRTQKVTLLSVIEETEGIEKGVDTPLLTLHKITIDKPVGREKITSIDSLS